MDSDVDFENSVVFHLKLESGLSGGVRVLAEALFSN